VGHFRFVKRHLHDEPNKVVHAALKKIGHVTDTVELHNMTMYRLETITKDS
jgi:hypothetical protein